MRIRLAGFNVRANPPMRTSSAEHDLAVARGLARVDAWGWHELPSLARYRRALLRAFPPGRFATRHLHHRNAQTVDLDCVRVLETRHRVLSPGARLLPQPPRTIVASLLQDLATGEVGWAVSAHFTNGGFNWSHPLTRRARRRRWFDEHRGAREFQAELLETASVWGEGDLNHRRPMPFHPDQEWGPSDGVMHSWFIPGRGREGGVDEERSRVVPKRRLKTDHAALVLEAADRPRNRRG